MIDIRDLLLYVVLAKSRGVELCFDAGQEGLRARIYRSNEGTHMQADCLMPWDDLRQGRMDVVDRVVNDLVDGVLTARHPMVEAIQGGAPHYTLPG